MNNAGKRYEFEEEKEVPGEVVETKVEKGKRVRDDTLGQALQALWSLEPRCVQEVECGEDTD